MTNRVHTQYPYEYQQELDRLYHLWSRLDRVADNALYEDEFKNNFAEIAYTTYTEHKRDIDFHVDFPHAALAASTENWGETAAADFHVARECSDWPSAWKAYDNYRRDYDNTIRDFEAGTGRM